MLGAGRPSRRDLLVSILIVCAGSFFCAAEFFGHFQLAWTYEFSEYADMARSIATTGRLTTHFIQPIDLAYLEERGMAAPPWPMTHRFPLYPYLASIAFRLFGASDGALVALTSLTSSACAVLVYFAGKRLFPRHPATGPIAALLFVLNPFLSVYFVMAGYTELLFSALVLAGFAMIARELSEDGGDRGRTSTKRWLAAGVIGGLAYLSRFNFVMFAPIAIAAIILRRPRAWRSPVLLYVGGFAALALPWALHRAFTVGPVASRDLVSNLADVTGSLPWLDRRTLALGAVIQEHGRAIVARAFRNLFHQARWFFTQYEMYWLVPFSLAGGAKLAQAEKKDPRRIFALLYAGALLVQLAFFAFLRVEPKGRYFVWISPCMMLLGAEAYLDLVSAWSARARRAAHVLAVALVLVWTAFEVEESATPRPVAAWDEHPPRREVFPEIMRRVPEDAIVISNIGVHLGWYANRTAIDLPNTLEDTIQLARDYRVRHLVIATWVQGEIYNRPFWGRLLSSGSWEAELGRQIRIKDSWRFPGGVLLELDPIE
jgi:4-amino-4-deoxy-L-arabinose transferase-like glycosyltransferase